MLGGIDMHTAGSLAAALSSNVLMLKAPQLLVPNTIIGAHQSPASHAARGRNSPRRPCAPLRLLAVVLAVLLAELLAVPCPC